MAADADIAQACSLELDRGLQTGRCRSLCSTSALVSEFVQSFHTEPSEREQRGAISGLGAGGVDSYVPHVRVDVI